MVKLDCLIRVFNKREDRIYDMIYKSVEFVDHLEVSLCVKNRVRNSIKHRVREQGVYDTMREDINDSINQ